VRLAFRPPLSNWSAAFRLRRALCATRPVRRANPDLSAARRTSTPRIRANRPAPVNNCIDGTKGYLSLLVQELLYQPASPDVRSLLTAVTQNCLIGTPGVFEGICQQWQVTESSVVADGYCYLPRGTLIGQQPGWVDFHGATCRNRLRPPRQVLATRLLQGFQH